MDVAYACSVGVAAISVIAIAALALGGKWEHARKEGLFVFWAAWGMLWIAIAAYHSGQTYHPCVTEWSTMKQACK